MPNTKVTTEIANKINTISFRDANVWPFLFFAALISFCQASLLQSIGFYITDIFSDLPDLPLIISICFSILSISTIISQYLFTDLFGLDIARRSNAFGMPFRTALPAVWSRSASMALGSRNDLPTIILYGDFKPLREASLLIATPYCRDMP